jgi:hypothetical protein
MKFWRRKSARATDTSAGEDQPAPLNNVLGPLFGALSGDDMPASLTPGVDAKKTKVFSDEVDPAWREPESDE